MLNHNLQPNNTFHSERPTTGDQKPAQVLRPMSTHNRPLLLLLLQLFVGRIERRLPFQMVFSVRGADQ